MAVTKDNLEAKLREHFEPAHLEITDTSGGCGAMFETVIVSDKFTSQPLIKRHRMVNEALAEELQSIHAFSMKTYTPEQYEKMQSA